MNTVNEFFVDAALTRLYDTINVTLPLISSIIIKFMAHYISHTIYWIVFFLLYLRLLFIYGPFSNNM